MKNDTDNELDLDDIVDNSSIFSNESEGSEEDIFDGEVQTVLSLRVPSDDLSDDVLREIFEGAAQPSSGSIRQEAEVDDVWPNLSDLVASIQLQSGTDHNSPDISAELARQIRDIILPLSPQLRPVSDDTLIGMYRDWLLPSPQPEPARETIPEEPKRKYRNRPTGLKYKKKPASTEGRKQKYRSRPKGLKHKKSTSRGGKHDDVSSYCFRPEAHFRNTCNNLVCVRFETGHNPFREQDWITKEAKRQGRRDHDSDGGERGSMYAC
jgi:hypothetical protein